LGRPDRAADRSRFENQAHQHRIDYDDGPIGEPAPRFQLLVKPPRRHVFKCGHDCEQACKYCQTDFRFTHINLPDCRIQESIWREFDPRPWTAMSLVRSGSRGGRSPL
jgi:hypothetical protein